MHPHRRMVLRASVGCALIAVVVFAEFVRNGLASRSAEPVCGSLGSSSRLADDARLTVMAFNLAKCGVHQGGLSFRKVGEVQSMLDEVATLIRDHGVDIVFLSEVIWEAGPCPLNQVTYLAEASGLGHYAFGENYSYGLRWYRIRQGNAVISKVPLTAVSLQQLTGERSLFDPTNERRALWVEVQLGGRQLLAASIRNDSFDLANNAEQVRQILDQIGGREALLAGDFNAEPGTEPMHLLQRTGRFRSVANEPTFPAHAPVRQIDDIFAPVSWEVVEVSVPDVRVSDHRPVIGSFGIPL